MSGKRCAAAGCSNTYRDASVHTWPGDLLLARKWDKFISLKRKDFEHGTSQTVICGKHFQPSDFSNLRQWQMGFARKLLLKPDAVPSIHANTSTSVKRSGSSSPLSSILTPTKRQKMTPTHQVTTTRAQRLLEGRRLIRIHEVQKKRNGDKHTTCTKPVSQPPAMEVALATDMTETQPTAVQVESSEVSTNCKGTQCKIRTYRRAKGCQMVIRPRMVSASVQCSIDDIVQEHRPSKQDSEGEACDACKMQQIESSQSESILDVDVDDEYFPSSDEEDDDDHIVKPDNLLHKDNERLGPQDETKFLVFESALLELFNTCPECKEPTQGKVSSISGTAVHIVQECGSCGYNRRWRNQPYHGQMPLGNLLLSAAMLFSGCLPTKFIRTLQIFGLAIFHRSTYFRHQSDYLEPVIFREWERQQQEMIATLAEMDGGLILAGDARNDSPGHCAKYGTYSVIEQRLNKVLDVQVVQSNQVKNSCWCELEGLKRSTRYLESKNLSVDMLITDRHRQVEKYIAAEMPNTKHRFDIWHVAKGTGNKVDQIAKRKDCSDIGLWRNSIVNHLYWSAVSSDDDNGELIVAKWEMLGHHMQNVHTDLPNPLMSACPHGPLDENARKKQWLLPQSVAAVEMDNLIMKERFLQDVSKLSCKYQTSGLESFHSLMLHFAPKHTAFSNLGMRVRMYLAAFHYNENSNRLQAVRDEDGTLRYSLRFPKFKKGGFTIRKEMEKPTYNYARNLLISLLHLYQSEGPENLRSFLQEEKENAPPTLASGFEHPAKDDAVAAFVSRFNYVKSN